MNIETVCTEILEHGIIDWVPLLRVAELVRNAGAKSHAEIVESGLRAIRCLLEGELVEIGEVETPVGFEPWLCPIDDIMSRVAESWRSPNWVDWGFVCWLSLTQKGVARAESQRPGGVGT